jgi:hypothetical protein
MSIAQAFSGIWKHTPPFPCFSLDLTLNPTPYSLPCWISQDSLPFVTST